MHVSVHVHVLWPVWSVHLTASLIYPRNENQRQLGWKELKAIAVVSYWQYWDLLPKLFYAFNVLLQPITRSLMRYAPHVVHHCSSLVNHWQLGIFWSLFVNELKVAEDHRRSESQSRPTNDGETSYDPVMRRDILRKCKARMNHSSKPRSAQPSLSSRRSRTRFDSLVVASYCTIDIY